MRAQEEEGKNVVPLSSREWWVRDLQACVLSEIAPEHTEPCISVPHRAHPREIQACTPILVRRK